VINLYQLRRDFRRRFGSAPRLFLAPGRVNLIGEHTDYNDGFVLPLAIDRVTIVAAAPRADRVVRAFSTAMNTEVEVNLEDLPHPLRGTFGDFVEGMARVLELAGVRLTGADLLIESDVPTGAGLSSSAALEIALGLALLAVSGQALTPETLALAGQRAEHEFVGTLCGVMDQLVVALGQRDHALLLDCRSLEHQLVPLDEARAVLLVSDTQVKHAHASSGYNCRRRECERAVSVLRAVLPGVRALRDVTSEGLDANEHLLPEPERRRARHVVSENARTLRAADALRRGDLGELGELMFASHRSLRDDYEVSVPELDCLVEAAAACPGVFGARMTGGGFGGCTVTLVEPAQAERVAGELARAMSDAFGREPMTFVTRASDGGREVD
jgi:galactokinase